MTGRTHDLAAFTALNLIVANQPLISTSLATVLVAFGANFLGGLAPDFDEPTAKIWINIRGGSYLSRLVKPIIGGHRLISHSLLGVAISGVLLNYFLTWLKKVLLVDMNIVWWAFMIGYVSHLVIDMITKEGVPWLFPIPIRFGIPPFKALRIKTGGIVEKSIIFPGLILLNGFIFYTYYGKYLELLKRYLN